MGTHILDLVLNKKGKNNFKKYLQYEGKDYTCDVCGIADTPGKPKILTKHHIVRQSIKKDNRVQNLALLCREDHDEIERFYDWVISFNVPLLWSKRRSISNKVASLKSLASIIKNPKKEQPQPKAFVRAGFDESIYWTHSRNQQIAELESLANSLSIELDKIDKEINKIVLRKIDWQKTYKHAVKWAKNKRGYR